MSLYLIIPHDTTTFYWFISINFTLNDLMSNARLYGTATDTATSDSQWLLLPLPHTGSPANGAATATRKTSSTATATPFSQSLFLQIPFPLVFYAIWMRNIWSVDPQPFSVMLFPSNF